MRKKDRKIIYNSKTTKQVTQLNPQSVLQLQRKDYISDDL